MTRSKTLDLTVMTGAVLGSLVLLNVLSVSIFGRLDLTRDQQFTLNAASRTTVRNLKEPVTVKAYFTRELPPPYSTNARYVRDLLEEYYNASSGEFRYEFIDPEAEETEEDREKKKDVKQDIFGRAVREQTSVERELQSAGVPPVQVQVNEDDKLEVKRAYMGIVIKYGDKSEVIPVVKDTNNLEYEVTTLIRKLVRERAPKIAFIGGKGGPSAEQGLERVTQLLQHNYEVASLDLSQEPQIPEDVDAIIVVGPKTPFTEAELKAIDAFVMSGRSAAFLLDSIVPNLQTLTSEDAQHGMGALLEAYGAKLEPGLVLDPKCATLNVAEQRGPMRIMQPVRYPFVPVIDGLDPNHPLTRGLAQISFPFVQSVVSTAHEGVKFDALVKSSETAWLGQAPYNLDPRQRWTQDMVQNPGVKNLLVTLTGAIRSPFGDPTTPTTATNARVLVAGSSTFVQDQFLNKGNETLLLNLVDWLALDEALLAVRSRGLSAAPLDELKEGTRALVKYGNILGLPLAFVAFGLLRWRMREGKRSKVTL